MEIISEFVKEQKRYSKNDLKRIYNIPTDGVDDFIRNLKAFGVLKAVKNSYKQRELSDLVDEDIEIANVEVESDEYLYVFTYVGIITIGPRIIKCYPKYLHSETTPLKEMKQVLRVINRYGSKEQIINMYNGDAENSSFNLLAVILFLLNDYHDYGVYNNTEDIIEVNGEGRILWDRTVNESFSLISNNRPYYVEMYTAKTVDDDFDFFKRLHECILTQCSEQLKSAKMLFLFDLVSVNLTEETLDDFGDIDYILYRIQSELSIQFNTRKQILLKTLYAYISHNRTLKDNYGISMYGTNNFHQIWEKVCSEVFSNKLQTALGQLDLPTPIHDGYKSTDKLIDIIKKPVWVGIKADGNEFDKHAEKTLIPDLITISQKDDKYQFIILDAKYYNIQLDEDKQLLGQPGVSDVTKQYLYQLAYKNFLTDHKIKEVRNCFLMPIQSNEIIEKGVAKMSILSSLDLVDIQIRQLPAQIMYDYYINNKKMDVSVLKL